MKDELKKPWIVWVDFGYEGWNPNGYDTIQEAVKHESYGSPKVITRGVVDWEAIAKCPYPDCPKVKYHDCPVHGTPHP